MPRVSELAACVIVLEGQQCWWPSRRPSDMGQNTIWSVLWYLSTLTLSTSNKHREKKSQYLVEINSYWGVFDWLSCVVIYTGHIWANREAEMVKGDGGKCWTHLGFEIVDLKQILHTFTSPRNLRHLFVSSWTSSICLQKVWEAIRSFHKQWVWNDSTAKLRILLSSAGGVVSEMVTDLSVMVLASEQGWNTMAVTITGGNWGVLSEHTIFPQL